MLLFDLYHSHHLVINDSWYAQNGGVYHQFFLQFDYVNEPSEYRYARQTIGHSISTDLIHWEYVGTAIDGTLADWLGPGVATGSIAKYDGMWYMVFTSKPPEPDKRGIALAVSPDLTKWEVVGDGPVIPSNQYYHAVCGGREYTARIMADPYVYPEPIDGYYHIFINSHISHHQPNERGGQLVFVTKDFKEYECKTVAAVGYCDRMETAQVWKHGDKYYMYAGSRLGCDPAEPIEPAETCIQPIRWNREKSFSAILVADGIDGPYRFLNELRMPAEEGCSCMYIAKVMTGPDGEEAMLINDDPFGIRGPYRVVYDEKDGVSVGS